MSHHLPLVPDRTAPLFRVALVAGGLAGMAGVMLAALASHADTTGMMRPAADMLLVHAPTLLALGVMAQVRRVPLLPVAFALIVAGLALFCGDLISRAVQDTRLFAMAAPTGGMLMIVGWAAVALSASIVRGR